MKKNTEIVVGDLKLKVGGSSAILRGRTGPTHVTLHYAPQPEGKNQGLWTPHITRANGERRTLAKVSPGTLERVSAALNSAIVDRWVRRSRPVDLAALAADGWHAYVPDLKTIEGLVEAPASNPKQLVLDEAVVAKMEAALVARLDRDLVGPNELAKRGPIDGLVLAIRGRAGHPLERAWLKLMPFGPGGQPSWWATDFDWLPPAELEAIVAKVCGPKLATAMEQIAVALNLPSLAQPMG